MYNTSEWQRPKTVKRYLHPPKSERLFTIWPEGKIIMGENDYPMDIPTADINKNMDCCGIWAVYNRRCYTLDYKNAKLRTPEDGTPIHGVTVSFTGLEMDMEAFCNTERKTTCFVRITVTNRAPYKAGEQFGLLVRSGKEQHLVSGAPDGYCSHYPEASVFRFAPTTFRRCGNILRDGMTFVGYRSSVPLEFDEVQGLLYTKAMPEAGESYVIELCFGKGELAPMDFDYEAEKQQVIAYWKTQLNRLRLPAKIQNDPEKRRLVQNLTVQVLQCYAHYVGKDYIVPRQGALQRFVWVWDQFPVLEAISRLGDFKEFWRGAISMYFDILQRENGEVCTYGENWSTDTACALLSLATVCLNANDRELWETYHEKGEKAFAWIRQKRRETVGMEGVVEGLFPPMRGSDAYQVFQNWKSDIWNLFAMEAYAKAIERFGGDATSVRAEYEEYHALMRRAFAEATADQAQSDALHIPLKPLGGDKQLLEDEFYFYLLHGVFLYSGVIDDKDIPRVLKAMEREGISSGNGLYGHMRYRDGNTHIWYTTAPETYIFRTFMRMGKRAEAEQILQAQLNYSMSEHYYMCERFADNDPWFVPWMPNASAMGRVLTMLLDLNQG